MYHLHCTAEILTSLHSLFCENTRIATDLYNEVSDSNRDTAYRRTQDSVATSLDGDEILASVTGLASSGRHSNMLQRQPGNIVGAGRDARIPATRKYCGSIKCGYLPNSSVQFQNLCFTQSYNKNYDGCADA